MTVNELARLSAIPRQTLLNWTTGGKQPPKEIRDVLPALSRQPDEERQFPDLFSFVAFVYKATTKNSPLPPSHRVNFRFEKGDKRALVTVFIKSNNESEHTRTRNELIELTLDLDSEEGQNAIKWAKPKLDALAQNSATQVSAPPQ